MPEPGRVMSQESAHILHSGASPLKISMTKRISQPQQRPLNSVNPYCIKAPNFGADDYPAAADRHRYYIGCGENAEVHNTILQCLANNRCLIDCILL